MPEYEFRPAREEEKLLLRPLWREGFGDSETFMACYEARIFRPDWVEVAALGEQVVTMLSVIPAVLRRQTGEAMPGGGLYGLATLSEHRSRGLAPGVLNKGVDRWLSSGMDFIAIVPDAPALFPYYQRVMGVHTAFYVRETTVSAHQLPAEAALRPEPALAEAYRAVREQALQNRTHLDWGLEATDFQREICRQEGGDLFLFPEAPGCCAAAQWGEDGGLMICELLAPEELLPGCLAGLLARMDSQGAVVRLPAWSGEVLGGPVTPFGMIIGTALPEVEQAYLGFDFG